MKFESHWPKGSGGVTVIILNIGTDRSANSADPDQTAPHGAV